MVKENKGLSYSDAGVDIDVGNELIKRIKPNLKKTHIGKALYPRWEDLEVYLT